MGGALPAIERGYMQNEIQNAAYAAQQAIEKKEEIVVGVNAFQVDEERTLERLAVDPAIEIEQRARLKAAARAARCAGYCGPSGKTDRRSTGHG